MNGVSTIDPLDWFKSSLERAPSTPCIVLPNNHVYSYEDVDRLSAKSASALIEIGVGSQDRVLVQVDKSLDALCLYLACLRLNAVFVPINTANTAAELQYFAEDSKPAVAIIRPDDSSARQALSAVGGIRKILTLGSDGYGTFGEITNTMQPLAMPGALPAESLGALIYTSGTTGKSKGAMLTRGNIASNGVALAQAWHYSSDDILIHVLPLFHVHGLFAALSTTFSVGASLHLESIFDADRTIEQFSKATVFMGVPTHYTRLLSRSNLTMDRCKQMRLFVSGSAPLLEDTHREFLAKTGHTILERYGMTETLMNTSNPYTGERRAGTVGIPLPYIDVRVADHNGMAIQPNQGGSAIGEIQIRGPNVCAGYWHDPIKTAQSQTDDGWFKSGDLGSWDSDGYLQIVGRAKDLIITGGYNVYPKEVEEIIDNYEGVLESSVFGVPHPDFGEGVTAVVIARANTVIDITSLMQFLVTKLAKYKCPKKIIQQTELPRNTMGKVQKNMLRQKYSKLYQE